MQTTNNVMLVRPANFGFNAETSVSNVFQNALDESQETITKNVLAEFENLANTLKSKGVNVFVFDDTKNPVKPDAVFPNNWVTFHRDGTVILYPMCTPNRRIERRPDIIETLRTNFQIGKVIDLSVHEKENLFLEGTGSIVFDHDGKTAYACLSPRTDKGVFIELCGHIGYQPVYFYSHDQNGKEIYHTNVMMCIGKGFSVICLDSITDKQERALVVQSLTKTGHEIIDISFEQMNRFAGNMLAIQAKDNKNILALSQSSYDSLTDAQKSALSNYCELVPLSIKTIETIGGGSVRCMIAEIFAPPI